MKINYDPILGCTGWEFPEVFEEKIVHTYNNPKKWRNACQGHWEEQERIEKEREHPGTTAITPYQKRLKKNENNKS